MKQIAWLLLGFFALIAACGQKPDTGLAGSAPGTFATKTPNVSMRPVVAAPQDAVSTAPTLRSVLPTETLAYLRIPNLWGLLAAQKGSILDKAVGSEAYVNATKGIRDGLNAVLLADAPPHLQELLKLIFSHTRSPIEIVVLAPSAQGVPMPDVLLSTAVAFADSSQLDSFLQGVFASSPLITPLTPTDASGSGALSVGGLPLLYRYDALARRMFLLSGAGVQPGALEALLGRLSENAAHPMLKQEAAIDASGQGVFVWVDAQATMAFLEDAGQAQQAAPLRAFGGKDLKAVALGVGTSGGMHRAKLIVDMPRSGFRTFVPQTQTDIKFSAAGDLDAVVMFSLPSPSDLSFVETAAVGMMGAETGEQYRQFKQTMREELGFGMEDVFDAVGPELIGVFDEAGDYAALRIRDKAKLSKVLEGLNTKFALERERRDINGQTYHHYVIPSLESAAMGSAPALDDEPPPKAVEQYFKAPTHLYWREEGDYLLFGAVPQALIDRAYIQARTDVKAWLTKEQRVDSAHALVLASKRSKGMPAFMYDLNLQFLQFLGDLTDRPVDMFALPTAREAGLPEFGAFSFQVNTGAEDMSLELSFENNPAEVLFAGGGGMAAAATLGVVAAVAIPAYQDYTLRAQVADGLLAVVPLKAKVEEIYTEKKRFAPAKQVAPIIEAISSEHLDAVDYNPETGEIALSYNLPETGEANVIILIPEVVGEQLVWVCSSSIESKWLPQECRAE